MNKYCSPEISVNPIETSSILVASGARQSASKVMSSPSPTVKKEQNQVRRDAPNIVRKVTYTLSGDKIIINIPLKDGVKSVTEMAVVSPDGDKCIVYDSYIYTQKQFGKNGTDINYYVEKIQQALDARLQNSNISTTDIVLKVAERHISNHGRIIDGDLAMIISAVTKVTGQEINTDLEWAGMDIVLRNFKDKVFFTEYRPTPFGLDTKLIPASEF